MSMTNDEAFLELEPNPLPPLRQINPDFLPEADEPVGDLNPRRVVAGRTKDSVALVTKSNYLIEAKYKLGHHEQRFLYHLISQISPQSSRLNLYRISLAEISRITGHNFSFAEAEEFLANLKKRNVDVFDPISNRRIVLSWLSLVVIDRSAMTFDFAYDNAIKPYLLDLKERYTSYPVRFVHLLRRGSSIRVYELLSMLRHFPSKTKTYTLADLRLIIGIEPHEYPDYKDFRRWVIEPARNEINEVSDLSFSYSEERVKRKVVKITFDVTFREAKLSEKDLWKAKIADALSKEPFFLASSAVNKFISEERPAEFWRWAIAHVARQMRARPPRNPGGYAAKEIRECWEQWLLIEEGKAAPSKAAATSKKQVAYEDATLMPQADPAAEREWSNIRIKLLERFSIDPKIATKIADLIPVGLDGDKLTLAATNPIAAFILAEKLPAMQEISEGFRLAIAECL